MIRSRFARHKLILLGLLSIALAAPTTTLAARPVTRIVSTYAASNSSPASTLEVEKYSSSTVFRNLVPSETFVEVDQPSTTVETEFLPSATVVDFLATQFNNTLVEYNLSQAFLLNNDYINAVCWYPISVS